MAYEADRKVITSFQDLKRQVRDRVTLYVTEKFRNLGSWRDVDIDRFVAEVVPVVISGQKQVAGLTNSYLDSLARLAGFTLPSAGALDVTALRGIDPDEVYRRSGVTVWAALSEPNRKSLQEAVKLGILRLDQAVALDMQLAHTHAARARFEGADGVVGYRRVLTGAENCALCAIASTQRYHRGNLMPIHDRCDCTVAPIYGTHDPGQVINPELLEKVTDGLSEFGIESWSQFKASDATRAIRVHTHGEHGPTLTWAKHGFTSASDIGGTPRRVPTPKGKPQPGYDWDAGTWTSQGGSTYKLTQKAIDEHNASL